MQFLELKIHPPIVFLMCLGVLWLFAQSSIGALDVSDVMVAWFRTLAITLAISAVLIAGSAIIAFRLAQTTVHPHKPEQTSSLVTTGVFRLTRNPMYLALAIVLTSASIFLVMPLGVLMLIGFIAYITQFQIKPEERILLQHFGDEYALYRQKVRRWL